MNRATNLIEVTNKQIRELLSKAENAETPEQALALWNQAVGAFGLCSIAVDYKENKADLFAIRLLFSGKALNRHGLKPVDLEKSEIDLLLDAVRDGRKQNSRAACHISK